MADLLVTPPPAEVIPVAAGVLGVSVDQLVGPEKTRPLVQLRWVAMAAARQACAGYGYVLIGRAFNRDHTTVMHACCRVRESERMTSLAEEIAAAATAAWDRRTRAANGSCSSQGASGRVGEDDERSGC